MALYIRYFALCMALICAVIQDISKRKVKNWLVLALAATGAAVNAFDGLPGLLSFAAGLLPALALGMLLWALKAFRAGDAKLYAALGGLMGLGWIWRCYVFSFLAGGAAALCMLARTGRLRERLAYMRRFAKAVLTGKKPGPFEADEALARAFPFTLAIAAGAALTELWLRFV